jgi:hypothetical protein
MEHRWHVWKPVRGNTLYAARNTPRANGKKTIVSLHRFLMGLEARRQVDHRDGNGLNCTRSNMRPCSNAENNRNKRKYRNNTSGYKGVYWSKQSGKWFAKIVLDGRPIHLGSFRDIRDAALAYDQGAMKYHKDFGKTNL